MKKWTMVITVVWLAASAGLVWADAASKDASKANPQPLSPQGQQQIGGANSGNNQDGDGINPTDTHEGGGKDTGDGADDSNLRPNKGKKTQDDWERKAGGKNATLHDQNQISGNLNGGGHSITGGDKGLHKDSTKGGSYDKYSKVKGSKTGNGLIKQQGFVKSTSKAGITDGTSKANGPQKNGFMKDANGFQKANGALNGNLHNNGAMGDGSVRGQ